MTACRAANLEWLIQSEDIPHSVKPLAESFLKVSTEDHRGTRLADEMHFPPTRPPRSIKLNSTAHALLLRLVQDARLPNGLHPISPDVLELDKASISGVIYASEKSLPRDSNIIFRRLEGASHRVGHIKLIFQSDNSALSGMTFLVVSQHKLIADPVAQNVYKRFGFAGGFLCNVQEDSRLHVIRSTDVVCHFAKTILGAGEETLMHVLPLNMVRKWRRSHNPSVHLQVENGRLSGPRGLRSLGIVVPPIGQFHSTRHTPATTTSASLQESHP